MSVKFNEEEIKQIIQAVEENSELPEDMLPKLFPRLAEKIVNDANYDFNALIEKTKVPTIEYAGKRPESAILASASLMGQAEPLQVLRSFGKPKDDWQNLIVQGDNLQFLKTCYLNQDPLIKDKVKGKVKLIYIDPPFGTGDEYGADGGILSYSAKLAGKEFIEGLRERLIFLREILQKDGCIFVRMDYHFGHYAKILLDEVFGKENLINELIVNRGKQRLGGKNKYSTATDSLFFYSKKKNDFELFPFKRERYSHEATGTNMLMKGHRNPPQRKFLDPEGNEVVLFPPHNQHWKFVQDKINQMYNKGLIYLAKSRSGFESGIVKQVNGQMIKVDYVPSFKFDDDKTIDSNWTDISGYDQTTRYPTENSENLLERVILSGSKPGEVVIDCFGGSGTTAAVAEKLGRKWITCDFGKHAIYTMQKRMLEIADSKKIGPDSNGDKYGQEPEPFSVVSVGAYDFSKIMSLRENKEAYTSFVLNLFGITESNTDLEAKYQISNVVAEKDGDPVEVYPVWDDEYLKDIKIDEEYLTGIIQQSGNKLKGNYYIISPESCVLATSEKTLKNGSGGEVTFHILKFPYKILEEAARNFQIEEQPNTEANINNLVSSVGFYFNESVSIKVESVTTGLKIVNFQTDILDKEGNAVEGLNGLAMILIDKGYDGKAFKIDEAVYAKDIKDGIITTSEAAGKAAIIAVDKHGNETEITMVG